MVNHAWRIGATPTVVDRFRYGYDRNSNRLWRHNRVNNAFSELYHPSNAAAGSDGGLPARVRPPSWRTSSTCQPA